MSEAQDFVDAWINENVQATGYERESDAAQAKTLAMQCWAAADKAGISRGAIQQAVGDLVPYMASAIEQTNDDEVARLVEKDRD